MEIPSRIPEIAQTLLAANPGLTATEEQARLLMRLIGEQVVFELGADFGLKSAAVGRPQGPSQIAWRGGSVLIGWRILDGVADPSGKPAAVLVHPPTQEWPGQVFIPLTGIDHLKTADKPKEPPAPTPPDLSRIYDRLDQIERTLKIILQDWPIVLDDLHRLEHRRYKGQLGPFTIISTPE